MSLIAWLFLLLAAGSALFSILVVVAAWCYRRVRPPQLLRPVPISILKPLAGLDEGLEENLRSFFRQDYPEFELLFAVRDPGDPAAAVVEKLRHEFPKIPARLILTGEPPYPSAKVYSHGRMLACARHDLIVTSDSDARVTPGMLSVIAAEFQDSNLVVATCAYRAVPGRDLWSGLEAIGMNTEFLAGVLVARMLEGMKFAIGVTMAIRRRTLEQIGGFARVKDYPADDFVLGQCASELGRSILSSYVIEHRLGTQTLRANFAHRLRWIRPARHMRPAGYFGQLFTYPLPLAVLLWIDAPGLWPVALATIALRAAAAWATAIWILDDRLTLRRFWLVPLQDILGFALWVAGFFGNTITWRGRKYRLLSDGRFEPVEGWQPVSIRTAASVRGESPADSDR